ncbi:hypothetical protein HN51_037007, partial [Arachis hypogaea]
MRFETTKSTRSLRRRMRKGFRVGLESHRESERKRWGGATSLRRRKEGDDDGEGNAVAGIHPKEVELVDLIPRQRVSCAFVRIKISLLIAK